MSLTTLCVSRCSPGPPHARSSIPSRRICCCRLTACGCCASRIPTPRITAPVTPPRRTSRSATSRCCGGSSRPLPLTLHRSEPGPPYQVKVWRNEPARDHDQGAGDGRQRCPTFFSSIQRSRFSAGGGSCLGGFEEGFPLQRLRLVIWLNPSPSPPPLRPTLFCGGPFFAASSRHDRPAVRRRGGCEPVLLRSGWNYFCRFLMRTTSSGTLSRRKVLTGAMELN